MESKHKYHGGCVTALSLTATIWPFQVHFSAFSFITSTRSWRFPSETLPYVRQSKPSKFHPLTTCISFLQGFWYTRVMEQAEMENGKSKSLQVGVMGPQKTPAGGQGTKPPEGDPPPLFFFKCKVPKNPISWHFIRFLTATHKYSLLWFKAFFLRNKPGDSPVGGQGAKPAEAPPPPPTLLLWGMKTSPFPGTLSCFKKPLMTYSLLCFKAFFQRNKQDNGPGRGVRGAKLPEALGFKKKKKKSLNLRMKTPYLALIRFQTATHKILFTVL